MRAHFKPRSWILLLISGALLVGNPVLPNTYASELGAITEGIIYVDNSNQTGIEDGTQEHPYNTIQEGLAVVLAGDTVQVAAGTYIENVTLKDGVTLRGAAPNTTIIDGGQNGSTVTAQNVGPGTLLADFTIRNGTGTPEGGYTYGGGLYILNADLIIRNCIITENWASDGAGGLQVRDSTLRIERSTIANNSGWWGGAITLVGSQAEIVRNTIRENSYGYGGMIFIATGSQVTLENNLITLAGLAIGIGEGGTAIITNNTIVDNAGTGIATDTYETGFGIGAATIKNNILWGNDDDLVNLTATYSDIEDGDPGEGNLSTDPMFVNPGSLDYRLRPGSLCIDAGTNDGASPVDIDGDPRPIDGDADGISTVDMGAQEFDPDEPLPQPVFLPVVFRPCSPLFWDDFSDPNSGWPIVTEPDLRLEYLDGEYRIWEDRDYYWLAATPGFAANDYSLSVDLRNPSGVYGSYGPLFGLDNLWTQFYTFEIDPQGNFGIYLFSYGDWYALAEGSSAAIRPGDATNQLKIVRDGWRIDALVNGQLLASISDSMLTGSRYLGLIAFTYEDPGLDVRYDNFLVEGLYCPSGARTLAQGLPLTAPWSSAGRNIVPLARK